MLIQTLPALGDFLGDIEGVFAIDTETTSTDPLTAELVGVAMAGRSRQGGALRRVYIPLQHTSAPKDQQLPVADVIAALAPVCQERPKVLHNALYDVLVFGRYGLDLLAPGAEDVHDTMLMSYAWHGGLHRHNMDDLARLHLKHETIRFNDVVVAALGMQTFADVPLRHADAYSSEDAEVTLRLFEHFLADPDFQATGLETYEIFDRPLLPALVEMKRSGIAVDLDYLAELHADFETKASEAEARAQEFAGEDVNLGSPKALRELLFGRLGLKPIRQTETGQNSTDDDTLTALAPKHPIAKEIAETRKFRKLCSTYTGVFPVVQRGGRIHCDLNVTFTNTRRLSSSDPNLQNIPTRTAEGKLIRAAFVAPAGHKLVIADYSQIELRILAHVTGESFLLEAFAAGQDIHRATAATVFGKAFDDVTGDERLAAKTVVFAVLYGQGPRALAESLSWAEDDARAFIGAYFERLPMVQEWMAQTKLDARIGGYVESVFGNRVYIPNALSNDKGLRAYGERQAVNAVIQGTAADFMRLALANIPEAYRLNGIDGRLLLTVHDEALTEVHEDHAAKACRVLGRTMATAADGLVAWRVPIKCDAKAADNWRDAK